MDYRIIEAPDYVTLQEQVNIFLKLGSKLQGGVSVCALRDGKFRYSQAMTKEP